MGVVGNSSGMMPSGNQVGCLIVLSLPALHKLDVIHPLHNNSLQTHWPVFSQSSLLSQLAISRPNVLIPALFYARINHCPCFR